MIEEIKKEAEKARVKFGNYNSTHEAYAVLKEEVDEFWQLVKDSKQDGFLSEHMIKELIQISAVAYRAAMEIKENKMTWI